MDYIQEEFRRQREALAGLLLGRGPVGGEGGGAEPQVSPAPVPGRRTPGRRRSFYGERPWPPLRRTDGRRRYLYPQKALPRPARLAPCGGRTLAARRRGGLRQALPGSGR